MPLPSEFYNASNLIIIFKTLVQVMSRFCQNLSISVVNFLLQAVTFLYSSLLSILVKIGKMKENRAKEWHYINDFFRHGSDLRELWESGYRID